MVYIFFVQPGEMKTFDNEILMQSVGDLKQKIEEKCSIPQEKQVLIINGGEPLDAQKNLCSYKAGTDTNPIYLFSTNYDLSKIDISRNLIYDDSDLKQRLTDCLSLPASLATVKSRALVAADFYNVAAYQLEFCQSLVHEQHLQQQGWSAVIANLEDIVTEFRKRWELFLKMYENFIGDRDTYNSFLLSFEDDKKILQRIPVIETLLDSQKEPLDGSKVSETTNSTSETDPSKEISLYEWISSSDSKNSLDELYKLCTSNLDKFEKEIMPTLKQRISDTLENAEKRERKEIEGLGQRLFDLHKLLKKIEDHVVYQSDMKQSFAQHESRATQTRDTSILPDLCATHIQQMDLIKQCHQKLMDDRTKIVKAKYELSKSLCTRIEWVQQIENKLWELDSLLVYFHEHLQRLRKHLQIFQQLHLAPVAYMNAVIEVVRRRAFSQIFLLWASDLACQQLTIYNEEVTRRKDFGSQFEGHFLNALFPGMEDVPPPFAVEAPSMFDAKLPPIGEEDVERLKRRVPDYAESLMVPDMSHVVSFFTGKIASKKEDKVDDAKGVEDKLIQAVSDAGLASNLDKNLLKATGSEPCLATVSGLPNLKDDKGCESETDTEEFEKVGQSPLDLTFPQKQDASTSTEDNLQISRSEHDKLKCLFVDMSEIARVAMTRLRTDLNAFKAQFADESRLLRNQYEDLGQTWDALLVGVDENEKEIVECMRRENELEKDRFRYNLLEKEDVVRRLEEDKRAMKDRIEDTCRQLMILEESLCKQNAESASRIEDLLRQLQDRDLEREKFFKEIADLKKDHKAELDNIKSRFKLMTMERSPSLTSLEKEKSGDFASLPSHTTLLAQMTENFELDKERAVQEEQKKWEKTLEEKLAEFADERDVLTQVAKRIAEDKDKQIDVLRDRETNMNLEIIKYKTTIQQLAEYQEDRQQSDLMEEVDRLRREKDALVEELAKVKREKVESADGGSIGCSGSGMSKSDLLLTRPHRLNIDSCKKGDVVLVLWDQLYESFKVLQETGRLPYLVNPECFERLGLSVSNGVPNKAHCVGEVLEKMLCSVVKTKNRFKLAPGSKFYYVKVIPFREGVTGTKSLVQSQCAREPLEGLFQEFPGIQDPEFARVDPDLQLVEDSGIHENPELQATTSVEECGAERSDEQRHLETPSSSNPIQDTPSPKKPNLEIIKLHTTLRQLTQLLEAKGNAEEVVTLLKENMEVLEEFNKDRMTMSTSVAVLEGKLDASTSPLSHSLELTKSQQVQPNRPHRLNIDSCKVGDVVLLLWDPNHENFKVLQESKHTYFLHSDSLDRLGLTVTEGRPNVTYSTGKVVDKEYCKTKKSENRYKVPKGAKFFRVKVSPITPLSRDPALAQQSYTCATPHTLSTSQSVISVFDPLMEESQSEASEPPAVRSDQSGERRGRARSESGGGLEGSQSGEGEGRARSESGSGLEGSQSGEREGRARSESGSGLEGSQSGEKRGRVRLESGSGLEGSQSGDRRGRVRSESSESGRGQVELSVSSEKLCFAEDSGIVEEATAAIENSDRFGEVEQSTYVSTNWFEGMFRSMFSK